MQINVFANKKSLQVLKFFANIVTFQYPFTRNNEHIFYCCVCVGGWGGGE